MPEKNSKQVDTRRDDGVELETQFILRMPEVKLQHLRNTKKKYKKTFFFLGAFQNSKGSN